MRKYELKERFLPKMIHAIWAGGDLTLPDQGMSNLANWAYCNPDFTIILWVDLSSTSNYRNLDEIEELYKKQFTELYSKYAVNEEMNEDIRSRIQVKSIREEGICADKSDFVIYAIDRMDPNYGLSSDILRYRILYKYGGVYVDATDVMPGTSNNLNFLSLIPYAKFGEINEAHKMYIDHLSQMQNPSSTDLKSFNLKARDFASYTEEENEGFLASLKVGNDSFVCTAGNPLMMQMADECIRRLRCTTRSERIMMAYGGFNKKDITLDLSGPNMVKTVLFDQKSGSLTLNAKLKIAGYYKKMSTSIGTYIFPLKSDQYQIVRPPDNDRNTRCWNNVPLDISRTGTIEDVVDSIRQMADVEVNKMRVFRVNDYVGLLSQAISLLKVPEEKTLSSYEELFGSLKQLSLEKVEVAQCIANNLMIQKFYAETGLSEKTLLKSKERSDLPELLKIWEQCTSFGLFMGTQDFQPEQLEELTTEKILGKLKPVEILDLFQRIDRGLNFIIHVRSNIDNYPLYKELLTVNPRFPKIYMIDLIQKYCVILDVYTDAFLASNVDTKSINCVGRQLVEFGKLDILPKKLTNMIRLYSAKSVNHALRIAAAKGELEHVKYLAKYADLNDQGGGSKRTALHQAAARGHKVVMQYLIESGADDGIKDNQGKTAGQLLDASNVVHK